MGRWGLITCLLLAASLTARAQWPAGASADKTEITVVELRDPVDPEARERVERVAEAMVAFHGTYAEMPAKLELKIRLFDKYDQFRQYCRSLGIFGTKLPGAFYSPATQEMVVPKGWPRWAEVMVHEFAHHVANLGGSRMPTWINEGLAVFFETGSPSATRVTFRPSARWLAALRSTQKAGYLPKLNEYLTQDYRDFHGMPDNEDYVMSYGMAYTLVYYFMCDGQRREILSRVLGRLRGGQSDVETVLNQEYPGGITQLERDWQSFLRKPFPAVAFTNGAFTK